MHLDKVTLQTLEAFDSRADGRESGGEAYESMLSQTQCSENLFCVAAFVS